MEPERILSLQIRDCQIAASQLMGPEEHTGCGGDVI